MFLAYFVLVINYFGVFCAYFIMTVLVIFRRIVLHHHASTSRIQRALASDEKTNLQREKYKAITANGQNFRHTDMDDYYIFYTLQILTCISMKEQ